MANFTTDRSNQFVSVGEMQPTTNSTHFQTHCIVSNHTLRQGCSNPRCHAVTTTLCMVAPTISGSWVWNLVHAAFLEP